MHPTNVYTAHKQPIQPGELVETVLGGVVFVSSVLGIMTCRLKPFCVHVANRHLHFL
jgi:hypothetical protein